MKFRMILGALVLPTVVTAQQTSVKSGQIVSQPYRVVAIQEPVSFAPTDGDTSAQGTQAGDSAKEMQNGQADDNTAKGKGTDSGTVNGVAKLPSGQSAKVLDVTKTKLADGDTLFTGGLHYLPSDNLTLLPAGQQNDSLTAIFAPPQPNVRVNLNLRNAPLKEAVKQLSEQTKLEFALDADVPADARVTVVAKNIRLNTALDMITDATDLHWDRHSTLQGDAKTKKLASTYRIGKKLIPQYLQLPANGQYNQFKYSFPNAAQPFQWSDKQDKNFRLYYQELLNKDGKTKSYQVFPNLNGNLKIDPSIKYDAIQPLTGQGTAKALTPTKPFALNNGTNFAIGNTLYTANTLTETRSTFTCPHCKKQVTVLHQHQSPKCETCGRTFHDDWQFCPFDGFKRPAGAESAWQFCPLCGWSLKPDSKSETKTEVKQPDIKAPAKP